MIKIKKSPPLLFFFILLSLLSCKKEEANLSDVLTIGNGKWDVEWVTTYNESFYNSDDYEATSNAIKPGSFMFNANGTGTYVFIDSVNFNWRLNDKKISLDFNKSQIKDQTSPIIYFYMNTMLVSSYHVFSSNANTCKFTFVRSGSSSTDVFKKMEFVLTKH